MLERPPFVPGRRKRRRWIPAVSVVIVGLVLPTASLLDRATPRGEGGEPPVTAELATISAASYRVAVPPGLSRIAIEDADLVTFVTGLDAGYGSRLYRLWRLNLRTGGLIPGAVVASVSDLRLLPGREDLRLAFLVRGGGLFSLTGFLARRPQWLVGDVVAFDFPATRAPVAVRIDERTASRRGDLDVRVEVVRVEELRARSVDATTVRGVDVTGARVVGTSTYLWGVREGRGVLVQVRRGLARVTDLGPVRVVDVAPDRTVLVAAEDGGASVAEPSGGRRGTRLGLEVRAVEAWSADGRWLVAVGSATDGVDGLWLVDTEQGGLRQLDRWAGAGASAGFSPSGRLLFWPEAGSIQVLDLGTSMSFQIELPSGFPLVVGPIVAG